MLTRAWWLILATLLCAWGCAPTLPGAAPATPRVALTTESPGPSGDTAYTIANVTLSSGDLTNLVIDGSKIVEIGPGVSAGEVIDGQGLFVVPGFIDAHVHLGFFRPAQVLAGGLTTVRDLGWSPEVSLAWTKASAADPSWGPNLLAVGPMLTAKGGYPFDAGWAPSGTAVVASTQVVKDLAEQGVRFVKVTLQTGAPTLELEALRAVVDSAHDQHLKVTAHVSGLEMLDKALQAGVDELSHMLFDSVAIADPTIARMVKAGLVVVPTLRMNPSPERLSNLGRFAQAGGRVVFGTDMGNGGGPGIDVEELALMVTAGMEPKDVLSSATDGAADWLGLPERGRVAKGAIADLLLVRGDPLQDWSVLSSPAMVIREGKIVVGRER